MRLPSNLGNDTASDPTQALPGRLQLHQPVAGPSYWYSIFLTKPTAVGTQLAYYIYKTSLLLPVPLELAVFCSVLLFTGLYVAMVEASEKCLVS